MIANHKAAAWCDGQRDISIARGQFVRSWEKLSLACNLSLKTTRRSVDHLVTAGFLSRGSREKYSIYAVQKYGIYQDLDRYGRAKELPEGAVLLARKVLESSLWKMSAQDRVVAITCLLVANYTPGRAESGGREVTLARGQFSASWDKVAAWCQLPVEKTQESVARLVTAGFLSNGLVEGIPVFTISKYELYQDPSKYIATTCHPASAMDQEYQAVDLPFPPTPEIPAQAAAGQDPGSKWAASGQQVGSFRATNKKGYKGKKGEEGEVVPAPGLSGFENRGAPPPLPPTVVELSEAYQAKYPGVMGWKKTIHQILLFQSRGGQIQDAIGALERETRPRLPIWKVLDPLVDAKKSCVDGWIPPERRVTNDGNQGSGIPEGAQDSRSGTSGESPTEIHRLPMGSREGLLR